MKDEYDFSNGERGKFYSEDTTQKLAVYISQEKEGSAEHLLSMLQKVPSRDAESFDK